MSSSNIQIPESSPKFTNLQLELLRMYAHNVTEEELIAIKDLIARYLADRAIKNLGVWADQNQIDDETLEEWLNEKS